MFDKAIAIFCLVSTIIGDASANIIGKKYGRLRIKQKTLEGSIAFFSTAFLAGCLLIFTSLDITLTLVFVGSLIATLIEALPIELDDNLTVPIGTAFFMTVAIKLGGFA